MIKILWNKSVDSYITSKCGRFSIDPMFLGCERAQCYQVFVQDEEGIKTKLGTYNTQRDAKDRAQAWLDFNK